jgi:hypothetical protein
MHWPSRIHFIKVATPVFGFVQIMHGNWIKIFYVPYHQKINENEVENKNPDMEGGTLTNAR